MENYKDAQYSVLMFFSPIGLENFEIQQKGILDVLSEIIGFDKMKYKGFMFGKALTQKTIRKSKLTLGFYQKKGFSELDDDISSILLYLFDDTWSVSVPPKVFFSEYLVRSSYMGRNIKYKNLNLKSFYTIGIRNDLKIKMSFQEVFNKLRGSYGFTFEEVKYAYDGQTYLEWNHKNITHKIENDDVETWIEKTANEKLTALKIGRT